MSFSDGDLHVMVAELEEMARDLMAWVCCLSMGGRMSRGEYVELEERMAALGLEA